MANEDIQYRCNGMNIIDKIKRKITKLRFQPIRVFVFHQVSDSFDKSTMWECDWTQAEAFKRMIVDYMNEYTFISLEDAHMHLINDHIRTKKYAVLTCDDGWASIQSIIPWLTAQNIPVTLFLNPAYLLKEEVRERGMDKLINEEELIAMLKIGEQSITIGSHGWNHGICANQSYSLFKENVCNSITFLKKYDEFVPYFAYPCGKHKVGQDEYLFSQKITPVYCDGAKNYNNNRVIHRECIDKGYNGVC